MITSNYWDGIKPLKIKPKSLKGTRRKSVVLSRKELIKTRPLLDDQRMPLLVEPGLSDVDLVAWAEGHRDKVQQMLLDNGALLFRGFNIKSADEFRNFAAAVSPELLDYVERAAPRKEVAKNVLTSTEYPADQWIPLHHEMSYASCWPTKLFFYCDVAAEEGGFTPITDERETIKKIPAAIKDKFLEKGVMYVRNYGQGADMPWWEVFQTRDKAKVEAYLRETQTEFEWLSGDRLHTRMHRQVTATHPITGDTVWFNHAYLFHSSNMPESVRKALLEEFSPEELPRNSFYGDGTPIEDEVAETLRQIYLDNAILFSWQKGDIMILDNFLTAHGRSPFKGERKIYVAMSELYKNPDYFSSSDAASDPT